MKFIALKRSFLAIMYLIVVFLLPLRSVLSEDRVHRIAFIMELEGPINPAMAMYLHRGFKEAKRQNAHIIILRLDTPGGLASSMRSMVKDIMNSDIPVVVFVAPKGAGAASAGVLITISAHIAAMAPGTNIGAAHPVTVGGKDINRTMNEKVLNDMASYGRGIAKEKGRNHEWVEKAIRESVSITAKEALKKGVIDMVASDMDELFKKLNGVVVDIKGEKITLHTKDIERFYFSPGLRDKILKTISDPNIAYILMMIGLAGLYFELAHPGAIFPGVIGGISLILAFYSFQTLPVNYAGLLLIMLGIIFFIAELKVQSYGLLTIGGLISLALGSIMLFEDLKVSLRLMAPTIVLIGAFFAIVSALAFKAYRSRPRSGLEGLIGEIGIVKEDIDPEGLVFVHGEYWKAVSDKKIPSGEKVQVQDIEGLLLKVKQIN